MRAGGRAENWGSLAIRRDLFTFLQAQRQAGTGRMARGRASPSVRPALVSQRCSVRASADSNGNRFSRGTFKVTWPALVSNLRSYCPERLSTRSAQRS